MKRFLKFFAPDGDNGGGAAPAMPTIDVPEIAPAAAESTITDVDLGASPAEEVAGPKVLGPKEAGFGDPEEEMERMEAATENRPVRERGPDGKFIPKGGKKPEEAKPVAAKPTAKPAPKAKADPEPAKPTKVKIGDEEKTPEEWAAELKEAREKLKAAADPTKPAEQPKAEQETKPEDQQKADEERFNEFIKTSAAKYLRSANPKDKNSIDNILAGGEGAVQAYAEDLARVEANTRMALTGEFNRLFKGVYDQMQPLLEHHRTISEYQTESGFLSSNPEIQSHPQGYQTYKETKALWEKGCAELRDKVANNTATPREKALSMLYDSQTPEETQAAIAAHTKETLAKIPVAPAVPKPTDKSPNAKPAPVPAAIKPFNGDRPNGGSAPLRTESEQARQLREMTESGR